MRTIFTLLILSLTLAVAAQKTSNTSPTFSKDYWLKKSRSERTGADVCLIAGVLTGIGGGLVWFLSPVAGLSEGGDVKGAERTGKTLVVVGGSLVAVSIPLFIASKKSREKARLFTGTTSLRLLSTSVNQVTVGLRIPLR